MRVAAKAKRLSRKMLEQCTELFTANTVMRWYNKLIAEKYDGSGNRGKVGRPQITAEIILSSNSRKKILVGVSRRSQIKSFTLVMRSAKLL
jgi:hypothetical protein